MVTLVITNFGNVVAEFAGIASSLELFGWSKYIVVPGRAAFLVWALVVRGTYDSIEKIFLTASAFYICYIVAGVLAHPGLEGRGVRDGDAPRGRRHPELRLPLHGDRARRHDDRAVDAVLPAGVGRREGRHGAAVPRVALGRHHRLHLHGRRRVVHHRRLRGDALRERRPRHQGRRRRGEGAAAARGRVRLPAVCGGAVQRVALRGVDPADFDGVRRLRRAGVRIGARQEVPRSAGLLLAVHRAHRRWAPAWSSSRTCRSSTSRCSRRS